MDHHLTGEIREIFVLDGSTCARVLVDGSYITVPIFLLMNARVDDQIVVDAGIAITRIERKARLQQFVRNTR